jgi:hypothetical protein
VVSAGTLLQIDLAQQTIESIPMPENVVSIGSYEGQVVAIDERRSKYDSKLLVRLPKELQILTNLGERLRTIRLSEPMQNAVLALRGANPAGDLILVAHMNEGFAPLDLYWIDLKGDVRRHERVTLYDRPKEKDRDAVSWIVTALVPMPLVLPSLAILFPPGFWEIFPSLWLPLLMLSVISLALAIYVYRRQRAIESTGALTWATFVFLLGPLGLAGYLLHRRWPAVASCEHCGKPVPRNRSTCLSCAEAFSPPPLKGIEVFA